MILAVAVFATACEENVLAKTTAAAKNSKVERGRYLVAVTGCNDCHSAKVHPGSMEPDATRLLAGRPATTPAPEKPAHMGEIAASGDLTAWYGPWGVSYAANLTPDPITGIRKRYDEASFIRAMRTGKKPEGTDILPPMPWPDFAHMSDADLKAIWAYLKTLKPVNNNVLVSPTPVTAH